MKRLIEYRVEGDGCIIFEVEEEDKEGMIPASPLNLKNLPVQAVMDFEKAVDTVKPAAATIIKKIRGISDPPDEVEVQFGLKLTAEAGAVIASAGVEANYAITLKWKREEKDSKKENGKSN